MVLVFDYTAIGKKIPYLLPNDTDVEDPEFNATIGVPVPYQDIANMDWSSLLVTLHNSFMDAQLFTASDLSTPENRRKFIDMTKSILASAILTYYMRG